MSESPERLVLKLEVGEGFSEAPFEMPITFRDEDGNCWEHSATFQVMPNLPEEFGLCQNCPNPFNPETTIRYAIASKEGVHTRLIIFNVLGQPVRTLVDERQTAGFYAAHWDGRDDEGGKVSSGTYFYRLTSGVFTEVKKMALVE